MKTTRRKNRSLLLISGCVCMMCFMHTVYGQKAVIDSLQQLYLKSNNDKDRIIYQSKIGFYTVSFSPDSAIELATRALEQAKGLQYDEGIASSYNTIGWAAFYKGQNETGIANIQNAVAIYEKTKNEEGLMSGFFNLSSIFIRQANYVDALKYLHKALPLMDKFPNHPQTTGIYKNLGIVYREMNEYDKAIHYFNQAIQVNLKNNNRQLAADIKIGIGILYNQLGKTDSALMVYRESYNLSRQEKSVYGMSIARENEGELYFKLKDYDKALVHFQEAKTGYVSLDNKADIAYISMNIARVYAALKNYPEALANLQYGLTVAHETGARNYEMDILGQLTDTYEQTGNYGKALIYFKRRQHLKDSLQSESQLNQLSRIKTEFETEQKDKEIALLNAEKQLQEEKNKRRLLFFIAGILIAGSLAVVLYIRSKLFRKETIIAFQQKQLAEQHQRETEQKLLRSQMSPHFIFNALNTIDSFVLQNRKLDASRLIQRFSKLSRHILEFSSQGEISLQEEMDLARVYLQIEQTRYNGSFTFSIDLDESIAGCSIPPMIIQPFVENAVIHGIKNRVDDGGVLTIKAYAEQARIRIAIRDNGVGRRVAQLIKKNQHSHSSRAMEITASRLAEINKSANSNDYLKYTDMEGKESGTLVEIWIPKIYSPEKNITC